MTYDGVTRRSFLKWAGGKAKSVEKILPFVPDAELFVDVFAGSGVVGLNVALCEGTPFKHVIFNDVNYDPIDAIHYAMNDLAFAAEAHNLFANPLATVEEFYYAVRKDFNRMRRGVVRAATLLYLNRHTYNGLMRYNSDWEFNAPQGKHKTIRFPKEELDYFREIGLRSKATIMESSFKTALTIGRGDGAVYYCDPPYLREKGFTGYSGYRFGLKEHQELAAMARELADRGATVLISNHLEAHVLYHEADDIVSWDIRHSINCEGDGRKMNKELLAIYRPRWK
jgi:DNA adenine methylase